MNYTNQGCPGSEKHYRSAWVQKKLAIVDFLAALLQPSTSGLSESRQRRPRSSVLGVLSLVLGTLLVSAAQVLAVLLTNAIHSLMKHLFSKGDACLVMLQDHGVRGAPCDVHLLADLDQPWSQRPVTSSQLLRQCALSLQVKITFYSNERFVQRFLIIIQEVRV